MAVDSRVFTSASLSDSSLVAVPHRTDPADPDGREGRFCRPAFNKCCSVSVDLFLLSQVPAAVKESNKRIERISQVPLDDVSKMMQHLGQYKAKVVVCCAIYLHNLISTPPPPQGTNSHNLMFE